MNKSRQLKKLTVRYAIITSMVTIVALYNVIMTITNLNDTVYVIIQISTLLWLIASFLFLTKHYRRFMREIKGRYDDNL